MFHEGKGLIPRHHPRLRAALMQQPQVDRRKRCSSTRSERRAPETFKLRYDQPVGHDRDHEAYYGWTGRAEVWTDETQTST